MIKNTTEFLGMMNGDNSYLISLPYKEIQEDIDMMIDFLANKRQWTCIYICSNKPYSYLEKRFTKKGCNLKQFLFIDTVSKTPKEKIDNVIFLETPGALTKIALAITQTVQLVQSKGFVFIDSLDGLSFNNNPDTLAQFVKSIVTKITKYNSKVLVLTYGGVDELLLHKISPLFDKVMEIEEN